MAGILNNLRKKNGNIYSFSYIEIPIFLAWMVHGEILVLNDTCELLLNFVKKLTQNHYSWYYLSIEGFSKTGGAGIKTILQGIWQADNIIYGFVKVMDYIPRRGDQEDVNNVRKNN
jgi:hypothetical protein